jgi:hypothetical protein
MALMAKRSLLRRIGLVIGALVLLLVVCAGCASLLLSKPLPDGETGPPADALAHSIETAIAKDAWEQTGAVAWTFAGRHRHLWDRKRMLARVSWGENDVLLNLTTQQGIARQKSVPQSGDKQTKLLKKAYAAWINDSFWLNPLVKLFDDGVARKKIAMPDGGSALLITYSGGGLTPGDSYLWLLGPDGRPRAWQMWVSIIPIKGIKIGWEGWTQLSTGAWVSTEHKTPIVTLRLTDVSAASTLADLMPGPDPFAELSGTR